MLMLKLQNSTGNQVGCYVKGIRYLIIPVSLQEVLGDMCGQDIEQQTLIVLPLLLHVLHLLLCLKAPEEVQPCCRLQLPVKKWKREVVDISILNSYQGYHCLLDSNKSVACLTESTCLLLKRTTTTNITIRTTQTPFLHK